MGTTAVILPCPRPRERKPMTPDSNYKYANALNLMLMFVVGFLLRGLPTRQKARPIVTETIITERRETKAAHKKTPPPLSEDERALMRLMNQKVENFEIQYRSPPEAVALLIQHVQPDNARRLQTTHASTWDYGQPMFIRDGGWMVSLKLEDATVRNWLESIAAFNEGAKWSLTLRSNDSIFVGIDMGWKNKLCLVNMSPEQALHYHALDSRISELMGLRMARTPREWEDKELEVLKGEFKGFRGKLEQAYTDSISSLHRI